MSYFVYFPVKLQEAKINVLRQAATR